MAEAAGSTVGVEEEYQIVDAKTGALRPRAEHVLAAARQALGDGVQPELSLSQVEIGTPVCRTLDEVRAAVVQRRRTLDAAARATGSRIIATGTHPDCEWLGQPISPGDRYRRLEDEFQQLAREQLICGCHVHVHVPDPDVAVRAMTDLRPWLSPLLALTANSPFWQGVDTGYASYRAALFARWPTVGIPPALASREEFDRAVERLVRAGGIEDASFLYWDVRPSTRYPTLEIRIADVCTLVDDVVLYAALCRALVRTHVASVAMGATRDRTQDDVLRIARWRAARFGLEGDLVDPVEGTLRPAPVVVRRLLEHIRPDLEAAGEWDVVDELTRALLARGNGAQRQRVAFARAGSFRDVIDAVAAETLATGVA